MCLSSYLTRTALISPKKVPCNIRNVFNYWSATTAHPNVWSMKKLGYPVVLIYLPLRDVVSCQVTLQSSFVQRLSILYPQIKFIIVAPPTPQPKSPSTLPLMINTLTTTEAATIPSMTDSVNGSNCLSDRLMRSGLRRYLQSTRKQLCDSNLVYHCCWRSQSTLNNSNISWEFIYALWWEVFPLGMSANLITWRWLQSVDDGRL